jgi:hypothetical protein
MDIWEGVRNKLPQCKLWAALAVCVPGKIMIVLIHDKNELLWHKMYLTMSELRDARIRWAVQTTAMGAAAVLFCVWMDDNEERGCRLPAA